MKIQFFCFTFFLLICLALSLTATAQVVSIPEPVPPPKEVRDFFALDLFYQQWIDVEGFPVLGSVQVSPYALKEAAWLIRQMIGNRRDLINVFVDQKVHFVVMAHNEVLSDIPEFSPNHVDFLVYNIRGEGGTAVVGHPTPTTGEENVLTSRAYNILIHELGHVVHRFGLAVVDPTFDDRLQRAYDTAIANGLWQGTYAASNSWEYWAEGTHAWFYPQSAEGSFTGDTRQALNKYDPHLASLLTEVFGDRSWRYTPVRERTHLPHLQGFNPQDAPTFQPSQELVETYEKFRNPYSDGEGKWVDLRPYDPRFLHSLNAPNVTGSHTMIAFINLTEADILLYPVWDGRAKFWKRLPPHWDQWTPTRPGAIYLIKDADGRDIALFQAVNKTGRALITPTLNLITPGLSKVSGDNQSGISGTVLANPFVVEVRDQNLSVLEGISVTFAVNAGGGRLSVTSTMTDENGRAESALTLGPNFGTNTVSVSAAGIAGAVTFSAVAGAMVDIPDPNLRAVVLTALGKAKNDPITPSEMSTLTRLEKRNANIGKLTGLENATNLTQLDLDENNITDLSPIVGLTNLTWLLLGGNNISDISALAGLTNLTGLSLYGNNISDISALAGLTNLTRLWLDDNNISDISPLLANTGLGVGDEVNVRGNPLNYASIYTHIPELQTRRVKVEFDTRKVQRLLKISGDNQQGTVGTGLTDLFVVEVRDRNGTVFAEVPVTFTVTEGSGTLSVASTNTDENGRAQSRLILGTAQGTHTVLVSAAGTAAQGVFNASANPLATEYLWLIPAGTSLIHVPLKVTTVDGVDQPIESISDLYTALGGVTAVNFLMTYDSQAQDWRGYWGASDTGTPADSTLTDDTGIIAGMKAPVSLRLSGTALGTNGNSTITLNQGLNLVGIPLRDERINRVSDLLKLDGIWGNVSVITLNDGGEFKVVGRAGDPGDIAITGGGAFILNARQTATVAISGEAWTNVSETSAAPLVIRKGIEVGDTTPVLGLKGSVVDEEAGLDTLGFRVTFKNLSSGRTVTGMTKDEGTGYQLTVVDIETARAATIGDILEISAQSPNPFIGVQSLQYTVTAEDVRQSWIQLPALVAYEIPAKTELLANYPNPFNPETWIPYRLAEDAFVTLTIYDGTGQVVRTLEVGHRIASAYENRSKAVYWDGKNDIGEQVASGVYFYHLSAGDYSATRKMVILK